MAEPTRDPSPEEIAAHCLVIQLSWSEETRRARCDPTSLCPTHKRRAREQPAAIREYRTRDLIDIARERSQQFRRL